jgi:hypothetical protein
MEPADIGGTADQIHARCQQGFFGGESTSTAHQWHQGGLAVFTNSRKVDEHLNTLISHLLRRSDVSELQDRWAVEGTRSQGHFTGAGSSAHGCPAV